MMDLQSGVHCEMALDRSLSLKSGAVATAAAATVGAGTGASGTATRAAKSVFSIRSIVEEDQGKRPLTKQPIDKFKAAQILISNYRIQYAN